jgi:type VI secretion system protein ImpE
VELNFHDGRVRAGWMPSRYAGSGAAGDSACLGRETAWQAHGEMASTAVGQRMWLSDTGDVPLFDIRALELIHAD